MYRFRLHMSLNVDTWTINMHQTLMADISHLDLG